MEWYSNDKSRYYTAINKTSYQKYTTLLGVSGVEHNVSKKHECVRVRHLEPLHAAPAVLMLKDRLSIQGSILNKVGEFHNTLKS